MNSKYSGLIHLRTACVAGLLPLLLLALPAVGLAQYTYTTNDDMITITGYTGPGGAVVIPGTITGLPVTSIGANAFADLTSLTSVTIPNGVTNIGGAAFLQCHNLTTVTIPDGVSSIGDTAFEYCTSLTGVTIPASVASIGIFTFSDCSSLTGITVDALNPSFSSVDGVLFNQSQTQIIQCPGGKTGSYTIPNGVTFIRTGAFSSCASLTGITIPDGVNSCGNYAFALCTSLTGITFPSSFAAVGFNAFYNSANLTGVYFRGDAPTVAVNSFDGATNATVYYLPGATGWLPTLAGRPTALWKPRVLTGDGGLGVRTNQFGFKITWASGMDVAVEACTNLTSPVWVPLQTNTLTGDRLYFSDPGWTNQPARFYRLRSP